MKRIVIFIIAFVSVLSFTILLYPDPGRCEFPVDIIEGSGFSGSFHQPSGYLAGTVFHMAFIGSPTGTTPFKVYYCPIDASANFDDSALTGDTLRLKNVTLVDLPVPAYADGRTPWIFPIADGDVEKVGIAFIGDTTPFFALVDPNLDDSTLQPVVGDVRTIPVNPSVNVTSLTSTSDGSGNLHLLYFDSGDIYYASTPFDDFTSPVDNIFLDTSATEPQLVIGTDSDGNAHGAWSADDGLGNSIISYAMMDPDSTTVSSKVLIPGTRIFGQEGLSFFAPWLSVNATNSIYLSSVSSSGPLSPGTLYLGKIDPTLAPRDGNSLTDPDEIFSSFPTALGMVFKNPVMLSDSEDRIHVSGSGTSGTGLTFATAVFSTEIFSILQSQKPVSLVDTPEPLDPFDRTALAYFSSGKAVIGWSGLDTPPAENHIFVISTTAPAFPPQPENESGCAVNSTGTDTAGKVANAFCMIAPAIFFSLASRVRKRVPKRWRR